MVSLVEKAFHSQNKLNDHQKYIRDYRAMKLLKNKMFHLLKYMENCFLLHQQYLQGQQLGCVQGYFQDNLLNALIP